jgi:hypothetical protein
MRSIYTIAVATKLLRKIQTFKRCLLDGIFCLTRIYLNQIVWLGGLMLLRILQNCFWSKLCDVTGWCFLTWSISILSCRSSPSPTIVAVSPFLLTTRIRTPGVGAVLVTMFVPVGWKGTLGKYIYFVSWYLKWVFTLTTYTIANILFFKGYWLSRVPVFIKHSELDQCISNVHFRWSLSTPILWSRFFWQNTHWDPILLVNIHNTLQIWIQMWHKQN